MDIRKVETNMENTIPKGKKLSKELNEGNKLKEAYALNLCTVSVSQIVEYQDLYIMEQEYDTILNNLNLEEMPKDEALLSILKQILDVITFFRIQDGDRKMIEKEFQHQQKNAIWSAVPNITGLVGSTPVSIVASLATQVGVGYMNYRKQKAENLLERKKEEWKLQRSAIEQLNALRRELFDTAWRMAEAHGYPDKYRLTERQIKRYNEVLMDTDPLRRYERLDYMKESFEAYPPFWYQLGHAANEVYESDKERMSTYQNIALDCYNNFLNNTDHNLLREDQLRASCALEKLGICAEDENKKEKLKLIQTAIESAGNADDVLQICAMSYLTIGKKEKAKKELRMLVNEGYNTVLNAQLLSKLYIDENSKKEMPNESPSVEYITLAERVGPQFLYPWENDEATFLEQQKEVLRNKYEAVLEQIITQYTREYNQAMPYSLSSHIPERGDDYSDKPEMIAGRKQAISKAFKQGADEYLTYVIRSIPERLDVLNKLCDQIKPLSGSDCCSMGFYQQIVSFLDKDDRKRLLQAPHGKKDVERLIDELCFTNVTNEAFKSVASHIVNIIGDCSNMNELSQCEVDLHRYCDTYHIALPELALPEQLFANDSSSTATNQSSRDLRCLMGEYFEKIQEKEKWRTEMVDIVKKYQPNLLDKNTDNVKFYVRGEQQFENYFSKKENKIFAKIFAEERGNFVAVLDDMTKNDNDLILLTHHLWDGEKKGFVSKYNDLISYNSVTTSAKGLEIRKNKETRYKGLNCDEFCKMCSDLYKCVVDNSKNRQEGTSLEGKEGLYASVRNILFSHCNAPATNCVASDEVAADSETPLDNFTDYGVFDSQYDN